MEHSSRVHRQESGRREVLPPPKVKMCTNDNRIDKDEIRIHICPFERSYHRTG